VTALSPGEPDPDLIAAAVSACSTVAGLSGGVAGEIATYLPGRRVTGVRVDEAVVTVHVVGRYGPTIPEISNEVTRAVTPLADGRQVAVVIEDLQLACDPPAAGPAATAGGAPFSVSAGPAHPPD